VKGPRVPIIYIVISNHNINWPVDLVASVNFLPFTICERLGLRELKSTKIVLQLVDHSISLVRGMIEDMLIKVRELIFPIEFLMLEIEVVMSPLKMKYFSSLLDHSLLLLPLLLIVGMEK